MARKYGKKNLNKISRAKKVKDLTPGQLKKLNKETQKFIREDEEGGIRGYQKGGLIKGRPKLTKKGF